jgi:hypothetical protein
MNRKKRIGTGLALLIVMIVGIYVYAHYNPEDYRFFPKCPVYMLTGYKCPGCGSQRAFYHLFQGNFMTAFRHNPLVLLLVPYMLLGIYVEHVADRANSRIVHLREIFFGKWAILALTVIILLFTVFRNIL